MLLLLNLPPEIIHQIASNLFYPDLLKFSDAIKSEFAVAPAKPQLKQILCQTELNYQSQHPFGESDEFDGPRELGKLDNLPCYVCMTVKKPSSFADFLTPVRPFRLRGRRFLERVCAECDTKAGGEFAKKVLEEEAIGWTFFMVYQH